MFTVMTNIGSFVTALTEKLHACRLKRFLYGVTKSTGANAQGIRYIIESFPSQPSVLISCFKVMNSHEQKNVISPEILCKISSEAFHR